MATLKANGYEVFRLKKVTEDRTIYERSYRSNGKILRKITVHRLDGTSHNWGWTVKGKMKHKGAILKPEVQETIKQAYIKIGWQVV